MKLLETTILGRCVLPGRGAETPRGALSGPHSSERVEAEAGVGWVFMLNDGCNGIDAERFLEVDRTNVSFFRSLKRKARCLPRMAPGLTVRGRMVEPL